MVNMVTGKKTVSVPVICIVSFVYCSLVKIAFSLIDLAYIKKHQDVKVIIIFQYLCILNCKSKHISQGFRFPPMLRVWFLL